MKHVRQVKLVDGVWQLVESPDLNKAANDGTTPVEGVPLYSNVSTEEMIRNGAVPVAEEIEEFERENGIMRPDSETAIQEMVRTFKKDYELMNKQTGEDVPIEEFRQAGLDEINRFYGK